MRRRRTGVEVGKRLAAAVALAVALAAMPGVAAATVPFPMVPIDGWDTNGKVYAVKVIGDTVYVGGNFTTVRAPGNVTTLPRNNLAAFDMITGDILPFTADTNNTVRALESDGATLWVGGNFSLIGGQSRSGLAAVDAETGAVLATFDVSNNGAVYGLGLGNGRLYAGGFFTVIEGVPQQRVASLDPATGTPDPVFQAAANESARDVVVSGNGRLFVGGGFTEIGGTLEQYLVELDPATGAVVGPGFAQADAPILDIDVTPDGSMVFAAVAGFQNRAQGWSTFDGSRRWYHRAMGDVQAVAYYDGILYFGFHEGFEDDLSVRMLAVDVLTGELEGFRPSINSFFGVWAIDANANGLAAGGEFTEVSGVATKGIAVFPGNGTPPDTTPPDAPSGLHVPSSYGGTIVVAWETPFDDRGVSYYRVFRDGALIGETLDTSFFDTSVAPDTVYAYRVQASDLAGNLSGMSAVLEVKSWTSLAASGDVWRHDDTPQTISGWQTVGFDDGGWATGSSQLGFGEGDESTVLQPGSMTYYFRRGFFIPAGRVVDAAQLGLVRDDGAVIYINGQEVHRDNMPAGPITATTPAVATVAGDDESRWYETILATDAFQQGQNVIAVEIHQRSLGSSDVSFDLRLDVDLVGEVLDTEPPTRPRLLKATARTSTRIRVSWQPASDNVGVARYFVYRDGVEIASTTSLAYLDKKLWPLTEYTYKVYAMDEAGNLSPRSRIRRATTLADEIPPKKPKNVTLTATPTTIFVNWQPAFDNVAVSHYRVKSAGKLLGTTPGTSFEITGREPETRYHVAVQAVDVFGNLGEKVHRWITTPAAGATYVPVPAGQVWRYRDDGSDQGTTWRAASFDDSAWDAGSAELGYGDGDEATVVASGPDGDRHITTYFRDDFEIVDAAAVNELRLRLIRDDGAVVYINGDEVYRNNMPGGPIDFTTRAATKILGSAEREWVVVSLPTDALVTGTNVIAVEIHQISRTSSDISFDAELTVNP